MRTLSWNGSPPAWIVERQVWKVLGWEQADQELLPFEAFSERDIEATIDQNLQPKILRELLYREEGFSGLVQLISVDYWCPKTLTVSFRDSTGCRQEWWEAGYDINFFAPAGATDLEISFGTVGGASVYQVDRSQDEFPYVYNENQELIQESFSYTRSPAHIVYEICGMVSPYVCRVREIIQAELDMPSHLSLRYEICVNETTADEGWVYASSGNRVSTSRRGGRAAPRYQDHFRQRWWYLCESQLKYQDVALLPASSTSAILSFIEMVRLTLGNTQACSAALLDPLAVWNRSNKLAIEYAALCQRLPVWDDLEVLGQACVAALYCRAVYGFTARAGMVDSVSSGAMTFSLQKALFDLAEDVDGASNSYSFQDMMGISQIDLLRSHWKLSSHFQSAYVVAYDHEMQWIVVAVRGTLLWRDLLTDIAASRVPFLEGQAHQGFVTATQTLLETLQEQLQNDVAAYPGYRLVFCGHSMGAALAIMAAATLRSETWASTCIAFGIGTPAVMSRCVCDRLANERIAFTIVNDFDWCPRLSETSISELIFDVHEESVFGAVAQMFRMSSEVEQNQEPDATLEQLPAGQILQIVAGSEEAPPRLLRAMPSHYRRSMPMFIEFEYHLPLAYIKGLVLKFMHDIKKLSAEMISRLEVQLTSPHQRLSRVLLSHVYASCYDRLLVAPALATLTRIVNQSLPHSLAQTLPDCPDNGRSLLAGCLEGLQSKARSYGSHV